MRITIIGSGNVATHIGAALKNAGHRIVQVYSRDMQNAAILAYHIKAEPIDDLNNVDPDTDVFIVSVKDDAIPAIVQRLTFYQKLILHTSGATSLQTITEHTANAGVFYPLQTFTKTKELNFWDVPLCIEGASAEITKQLRELASTISNNVYEVDSDGRKILHLAAVFACNFPNYLYSIAQNLLEQNQLEFNMIRPLIAETADKALQSFPATVQTGPAVRNDVSTMDKHRQLLSGNPMMQQIYEVLSQGIIKMDKKG
ncbi:DUF2520 domain-containing protein [Mucilaginibacter myungsuensis]|uniref:DUF2520 domain-containing protein n=2 Tax=Mucilaginibacter myungsuensis TaxID=649104 RepID=A0A929PVE4_9SPHI|nr:Rossmann-like and DUF2520 domain-containing protein [Mucilaginibacter myungsuensis]MBE9660921.1 DUF2520 domain-containing protein [Mucilaginibacter myungsuensis]MDN3600967.1 DUF2520 domain-containing protein [Mucilaginibacter myungsuensis]